MNIRAGHGEMHFDRELLLGIRAGLVHKDHVRGEDVVGKVFKVEDLFRRVLVDGGSELEVTGAEMELHVNAVLT